MINRAIIAATALALAGCSEVPSSNPVGGMAALEACKRPDVQDAVGKEARSMVLKDALPELAARALFGLVDLDALAKQFEGATVSASSTALQSGAGSDLRTIGCTANFKIDASNAIAGQDVVQIKRVRWTIRFADEQPDPASSNFTVEVDQSSLYEGMAINGEPLERILEQQAQKEAAQRERAQAPEAGSEEVAVPSPSTTSNEEPATPKAQQQPSPEELYAPEI